MVPHDPNALIGPAGYGTQGFIQPIGPLPYTVDFENDGSVAAQDVTVTEQLEPEPRLVHVPARLVRLRADPRQYPPRTDAVPDHCLLPERRRHVAERGRRPEFQRPNRPVDRHVHLARPAHRPGADRRLRRLPAAGQQQRHRRGLCSVHGRTQSGLATGTAINQQASVVFDTNAPINTAVVVNTIDVTTPTSSVTPLPATETAPSFNVSWSGSDGTGSGIASYDVYVSDDGGPYQLWQSATTQTAAIYTGQAGHTYSFYSVATSNVGLVQTAPTAPQATTMVISSPPPPAPPTIIGEQAVFTRKLNKKHKPVGKQVLTGFSIDFSAAMNPATAGNAANYQVDWVSIKRVKRKKVQVLHPVPIRVVYDAVDHSVSLLLSRTQAFAQGGQITVIATPPDGVSGASGVLLDGNDEGQPGDDGTFTILPRGRGVDRSSST